jgi:hypothetical protein
VRPDGHIAWLATSDGDIDKDALEVALHTWFGEADKQ